jgi:adenosine deaminase
MTALTGFFRAIPKLELHCHLLGTVRQATFTELAQRACAPLSSQDILAFYTRGEPRRDVLPVLRALDEWLLRTPDDLHRITYEYLQDAAAHNVLHSEFSWNPTGTVRRSGMTYPQALAGITRAMADARHDAAIESRLVVAIDREASPAEALQLVEWVIEHRHPLVAGIGIDYREADRPPELFAHAYAKARMAGLKTTAHAGEVGLPWTNVRTAVDVLKVDRVDHGYAVLDNPEFAARCAERGIVFTVVPTSASGLRTPTPQRWALDHPIRRMPAAGLRIHPNAGDPTLHQVDPTRAWQLMVDAFGFSLDQLRGFMLNGIDGAWVDGGQKDQWRREWGARFDALRAGMEAATGNA